MPKNIFDGYLLLSDLDGTLVSENVYIPERNMNAINYFKRNGGKFSIATGRNAVSVKMYHNLVKFNAPAIILNGGAILDCGADKYVSEVFVDKNKARIYTKKIQKKFNTVGIEIYAHGPINIIKRNYFTDNHVAVEKNEYRYCSFDDILGEWYKVFFAMDSDIIENVKAYAEDIIGDEVKMIISWANYLEMLPAHSDKGKALNKLSSYLHIEKENVCAIGDYYNDTELLKAAGICAVPENAPDDMKEVADMVVCSCDLGSVADFIYALEKKIET